MAITKFNVKHVFKLTEENLLENLSEFLGREREKRTEAVRKGKSGPT